MKKRTVQLLIALLLFSIVMPLMNLEAQSSSVTNVRKFNIRNSGVIKNQDQVQGYFFFYKVDKIDRKTHEYLIKIFDANLNEVSNKKITGSKYISLVDGEFNGTNIMLKFYDTKEKQITHRQYNSQGELVGKKVQTFDGKMGKYAMAQYALMAEGKGGGPQLFSLPGKGFIDYERKKDKKMGFKMRFFPNEKGQKSWTYSSNIASKQHQTPSFLGANEKLVVSSILKNDRVADKEYIFYLHGVDIKTGKKVFEKRIADTKYEVQPMNAYTDKETGKIQVIGMYFAKGAKIAKAKSIGLAAFTIEDDGEISDRKYVSWGTDVAKLIPVSDKGKIEDVGYIYFHKMVQTDDGKLYAIGEQYRKTASAAGIIGAMMGSSNVALVKLTMEDMAIFEFSPEFELLDVRFFDKTKSGFELPYGAGVASPQLLAQLADYFGGFDYAFTQINDKNNTFTAAYVDFEKQAEKGQRRKLVFGAITSVDGDYTVDKIDLSTDAKYIRAYNAKVGYVMLLEYYRKEKKLDLRLEKINY